MGGDVRCRHCRAGLLVRSGALDPKNPPPAPWALQPSHPELLEALAQVLSRQQLQPPIGVEADRKVERVSALVAVSRRVEESYAPYFARKFVRRLKAEEVYDSLVGATNLFTDADPRHRYQSEVRDRGVPPDEFARNGRSDSQGDPLLPRVVRSDEPRVVRAQQRRRDHTGGSADEQPVRPSSDQGRGGKLIWLGCSSRRSRTTKDRSGCSSASGHAANAAEVAAARRSSRAARGWEDLQWLLVNRVEFVHNF